MGGHQDPRLPQPCADGTGPNPQLAAESPDPKTCQHVDLHDRVHTPDVLLQPHMASLEMTFYPDSGEFPKAYDGNGFAAEHGSWNREKRTGYEVIRIPVHNGKADGSYEDFLTGFVVDDNSVWGRPVGIAVAKDGSLFVTDDGSRTVWHITYEGDGIKSSHGDARESARVQEH
jgi:glucose/arabinose dehydrogenase